MVRCLPPSLLQGKDTDDGSYKMLFSAVGVAGVWAMMLGGETEGLQGHPVALCAEKKAAHILLVTGSNRCVTRAPNDVHHFPVLSLFGI